MKKVLITGSNGFIGSNLIKYFNEQGYETLGWDISSSSSISGITEAVDLNDEMTVMKRLDEEKPDIIVHCAGAADVNKSVSFPFADFNGNTLLTHKLLFSLQKTGIKNARFVFLSSAGVYGNPKTLPIKENDGLNPMSPYALHKLMCENICDYFADHHNMDIRIVRVFSAYGNGLRKQIFWDMYCKAVKTGKLELYGTGNESRDYIHIKDLVQALFLIATSEQAEYRVFNIGNGRETFIRDVADIFADVMKIDKTNIVFSGQQREGNPLNWKADISRLQSLGYKECVDLRDGISEYIEWARQF